MTATEAILQLRDLVPTKTIGMFASITPGGAVHARPLTLQEIDDEGNLWFIVGIDSDWVAGMSVGDTVNFSVADDADKTWVSIAGRAMVVEDRARVDRLWDDDADHHFAQGKDTPTIRLLKLIPDEAEYWDVPSGALSRVRMAAAAALGRDTDTTGSIDLH